MGLPLIVHGSRRNVKRRGDGCENAWVE